MNRGLPPPEYGAGLLQAASAEERELAIHLLDALFIGDPNGRRNFSNRLFGAELGRSAQAGHSMAGPSNAITNAAANAGSTSNLPGPGGPLKEAVTGLLPMINAKPANQSPLLALNEQVEAFFKCGPDVAAFVFSKLQFQVSSETYKRAGTLIELSAFDDQTDSSHIEDLSFLWKSCKMASTIVLLLASSNDSVCLYNAAKSQSRSLGGLPTYDLIKETPSASFPLAFEQAKSAAVDHGQTTVLSVNLVDVHIFELVQRGKSESYFSFAHVFTIGIGPEGVIIWQAWGKHGYRLDEYIRAGHARVRDWSEADQFVRDFDKLANRKGTWNAKCNKLYKKLFLIDINQICGQGRPERPVTPKYEAWVRIHTVQDVTYGDVTKFSWSINTEN